MKELVEAIAKALWIILNKCRFALWRVNKLRYSSSGFTQPILVK